MKITQEFVEKWFLYLFFFPFVPGIIIFDRKLNEKYRNYKPLESGILSFVTSFAVGEVIWIVILSRRIADMEVATLIGLTVYYLVNFLFASYLLLPRESEYADKQKNANDLEEIFMPEEPAEFVLGTDGELVFDEGDSDNLFTQSLS